MIVPYITLIDIQMGQDLVLIIFYKSYPAQVAPFLPRPLATPQISPVFPPGFSPETKAILSHYKKVVQYDQSVSILLTVSQERKVSGSAASELSSITSSVGVTMSNLSNDVSIGISIRGAMR